MVRGVYFVAGDVDLESREVLGLTRGPQSAREQVRLVTHRMKMDKPLEEVALDAGRQVGATGRWLRREGGG